MSPEASLPLCPRCRRRIAAWKLDHCVYCGEAFPSGLRDGFSEPEALKWVERPTISPQAARQLEMLKIVPVQAEGKARSVVRGLALLSVPVLGVLLYMLWSVSGRVMPGWVVVMIGVGVIGYLVWSLSKGGR